MNWISVEDRLPKFNDIVLLWNNHSFMGFRYRENSYQEQNTGRDIYRVTHWCEITEPS